MGEAQASLKVYRERNVTLRTRLEKMEETPVVDSSMFDAGEKFEALKKILMEKQSKRPTRNGIGFR